MFDAKSPTRLEIAMDKAVRCLDNYEVGSEEYSAVLDVVSRLHKIREEEKPDQVSKDTMAVISANLLGIVMILGHERVNVITSKAFGWVIKPKS